MGTIKFEIEVEKVKEPGYLQGKWELTDSKGVHHASFCTEMVTGAPIIQISEGKNKGKSYIVKLSSLENLCMYLKELE